MGHKSASFFCGVLLILFLVLALVSNTNPIGFSKNALSRRERPEKILEYQGRLAWAGGNNYYNYNRGNLTKLQSTGNVLWKIVLDGDLLWMGPEGVVNKWGNSLYLFDETGKPIFEKSDFFEHVRVLCFQQNYLLLSVKNQGAGYAVLLSKSGDIMWQIPVAGTLISGSVHPKGTYVVLNIIDESVTSKTVLIGPTGEVLWQKTPSNVVFQVKIVKEGIITIAADRVFAVGFGGKLLYEYPFEGEILRGDIGDDGFAAVVVREKTGNLSQDSGLKILMLSSKGKLIWSYSLNRAVNIVKKSEDFVYVADDFGILILSKEGLLVSKVDLEGVKELVLAEPESIIAVQGHSSCLLKISGRG